jgi:hypothetical protein
MAEKVKKTDFGFNGKMFEMAVHEFCVHTNKMYGVTPNNTGRADFFVRKKDSKKAVHVEVKTGAGVLVYNTDCQTMEEALQAVQDSKWDYMVYVPAYTYGMDIGTTAFVMSKAQFMTFITSYSAPIIRFKNNTQGYCDITLQQFNSNKKQDYLWSYLESMPTVNEWLETVRA